MAKQLNSYEVKLDFKADTSQAKKEIQQFQQQLSQLMTQGTSQYNFGKNIEKDLGKAVSTVVQLKTNLQEAFNVDTGKLDLGKFQESMVRSGNSLESYKESLIRLGPEGSKAFDQLVNHISAAEVPLKRSNALLTEFWTTLKNTARWQISSSLLHGFMGSISAAYGYAQDLNESLNNIRIVTGYNVDKMSDFAAAANKAAQALSTTTTAYTDAALIYYQQGLSDEEVLGRTDVTIKLANVARESAETVSDQMTAVWNNFYDGSKSLEYYADVMTALGAATASSTSEISQGLEKFAAVADTVGLSYEYATAALATVTATTRQSADVVGTAFKTLFARLEQLKLGETLDDGTTLGQYSQALEKVGVNIKDSAGNLKDMDNILDELAAKWQTLAKDQQVALAQQVAGVRQYTQLIALMDNWDFMESNLEVARGAEGTLEEQAAIYAESWEAAQKRVKAAAEDIYGALLNDKFFIDLNNILAEVLKSVKNFSTAIGGLKGVLSALGAVAVTVFKNQIGAGLDNLVYGLKMTTGGQVQMNQLKQQAIASRMKNTQGMGDAQSTAFAEHADIDYTIEKEYLRLQDQMTNSEREQYQEQLKSYRLRGQDLELLAKEVDELETLIDKESLNIFDDKLKQLNNSEGVGLLEGRENIIEQWLGQNLDERSNKGAHGRLFQALFGENGADYEILKSGLPDELTKDIEKLYNHLDPNRTKKSSITNDQAKNILQKLYDQIGAEQYKYQKIAEEMAKAEANGDTEKYEELNKQYQAMGTNIAELRKKQEELRQGNESLRQSYGSLGESFNNIRQQGYTLGQSITQVSGALMSYASAFNTISGLKDLWSNDDISTGQKVLQTITSISMAIGLLTRYRISDTLAHVANIVEEVKSTFATAANTVATEANTGAKVKNAAASGEQAVAEGAETAITEKNTLAKLKAIVVGNKLNATMLANLQLVGAALAVLGFVVGIIYTICKAIDEENNALQDAQEITSNLKTEYENAASAAEEFKNTISDFDDGIDSLKKLTKGTEEYTEAVENSNKKAKELIETYGLFDQYSIKNGLIEFNEGALDSVQQQLNQQSINKRNAYLESAIYTSNLEKSKTSEKALIASGIGNNTTWNILTQEYEKYVQEIGSTTVSAEKFSEYLQENADVSQSLKVALNHNFEITNEVTNALQNQHQAIEKSNKAIDYYTQELLQNKLIEKYNDKLVEKSTFDGVFDKQYYDSLVGAQAKLNSGQTSDISYLGDQLSHVRNQASLNRFFGTNYSLDQVQDVLGENFHYGLSEQDIVRYYAQLMNGGNINQYSASIKDGVATAIDSVTGEEVVSNLNLDLLYQTLSRVVAQSIADGAVNAELDTNLLNILDRANAQGFGTQFGQLILDGLQKGGTFDFSSLINTLSQDEVNSIDPQQLAQAIGLDAETLKTLGIENGNAFVDGLQEAVKNYSPEDSKAIWNSQGEAAAEDAGIDVEAYKIYRNEIERTVESLHGEWEAVNDVALANMKLAKGLKTIAGNWEDYNEILTDSNANFQDVAEVLADLQQPLAEILNMDMETISLLPDTFAQENWDLITDAIDGVDGAIDRLRDKAGEDILLKVSTEFDADNDGKLDAMYQELHDKIAAYNNANFEVGYKLDKESEAEIYRSFTDIIQAAGGMSAELEKYFASMGYDVEVEEVTTDPVKTKQIFKSPRINQMESRMAGVPIADGLDEWTWENESGGGKAFAIKSITTNGNYGGSTTVKKAASGGGGSRSKGGGGGGSKTVTPAEDHSKDLTGKDAVVERYKEIDDAISDLTKDQERLNKVTNAYYGANKITYMKQQLDLLGKEVELHKERFKWAQEYYNQDKADLDKFAKETLGTEIIYDEDGSIKNYTSIAENLYSQLNEKQTYWANAANFSSKEAQDDYKKAYVDPIADAIDKFQDLVDAVDDSNENRKQEMDEVIALQIEYKEHEYEIWQEGWKMQQEIIEDQVKFLDHAKKMIGDSAIEMGEILALTYGNDSNYIQNTTDQLELYRAKEEELHQLLEDNKITQADYIDGLMEIRDQYLKLTENLKELDDFMMEYYGKVLDKVIDEVKEYTDRMKDLNEQLSIYQKIMKLTGRSLDYEGLDKILNAQLSIYKNQYDTDKETYKLLLEQKEEMTAMYNQAVAENNEAGIELYKKQLDELEEHISDVKTDILNDLANMAEKAEEIRQNQYDKAYKDYEDMMTNGMGFEYLDRVLEHTSQIQDEYLTKTNQVFETTKMLRKIQSDMDSTSNRAAKERLNNFKKEIEQLKNREKMTKADLELAQKEYDLLLAKIALEEAQQAKTTVRLQRDNEGNYGYVYTADEGNIAQAEDDYFNAENDLYNTRLRITNEYGQKILELSQQQANDLQALWEEYHIKGTIDEDTYNKKKAEILNYYQELMGTYTHNYAVAQQDDSRVIADAWINKSQESSGIMIKDWVTVSSEWGKTEASMSGTTLKWSQATSGYIGKVEKAEIQWQNTSQTVTQELEKHFGNVNIATESTKQKSQELAKEIRDDLRHEYRDLFSEVDQIYRKYGEERNQVKQNITAYTTLAQKLQVTIDKYRTLNSVSGIKTYNSDGDKKDTDTEVKDIPSNPTITTDNGSGGDKPYTGGTYTGPTALSMNEVSKIITNYVKNFSSDIYDKTNVKSELNNKTYYSEAAVKAAVDSWMKKHKKATVTTGQNTQSGSVNVGHINKGTFDTGGYTGEWSDGSGKLAVLHSKELVLNAKDTENMLAVVDMVRQITAAIDVNAAGVAGSYGALSSGSMNAGPQILEQNVQITASFPNATNHSEIEEAFNNLINKASQYANRTR